MNENVKIKLKTLKKGIANIQSYCECILKDIENVDVSEDMYVIAHNFDMIRFTADDAFDYSYQTMNLFEEEKK